MKTILKISLLLFFTVLNVACNHGQSSKFSEKTSNVSVIAPVEFQEKSLNQLIVDVRTPNEFNSGHIEGAMNIDFFSKDFLDQIANLDLDKSEVLFVYCKGGVRSSKAASKIRGLGFKKIIDLEGGINNWTKNNLKLVK